MDTYEEGEGALMLARIVDAIVAVLTRWQDRQVMRQMTKNRLSGKVPDKKYGQHRELR